MSKRLLLILALSVSAFANAQSVCDVAITQQAFDRTKTSTTSTLMSAQRDDLCSRTYASVEEAQQKARSAGFNLSVAKIKLGGSGAKQSGSSRVDISETNFCQATEADFKSAYGQNYEEQVANIAVGAWERCIEATQSNELFLNYQTAHDGSLFAGELIKTARTGQLNTRITGISVLGDASNTVQCKVGGKTYSPQELGTASYEITTTRTAIGCEKVGDQGRLGHASILIQTAGDSLSPVVLPSPRDVEQTRLDRLEAQLLSEKEWNRRRAFPIGAVIASPLGYQDFLTANSFDARDWVPTNGTHDISGTTYGTHSGMSSAPNFNFMTTALTVRDIIVGTLAHSQNVRELIPGTSSIQNDGTFWTWMASGREVEGNPKHPVEWENDKDKFHTYIEPDGTVIARGSTWGSKHGGTWGAWKAGTANVMGIATQKSNLNFYLKVN